MKLKLSAFLGGIAVLGMLTPVASATETDWDSAVDFTKSVSVDEDLPYYLEARGRGLTTSLFGSFVAEGELWVYPFYEYVRERRFEYNPDDFGLGDDEDYEGLGQLHQALIFVGYGLGEDWILELELSVYDHQSVRRAAADTGPGPREIVESGLGTFEGQLRHRIWQESATRPELYGFFFTAFPFQRSKQLIGQNEWELTAGIGLLKGFNWGTIHFYTEFIAYYPETGDTEFGAVGVDYIKRLTDDWRLVLGVESSGGTSASGIVELQYFLKENAYLKINNGFGFTRDEPQWAPEIGIMMRF